MDNQQDNQQNYVVYMHINKVNGKKYIGITCQKIEYRWGKQGKGYRTSSHFYNAIQEYGWDNFEHKIIASHLSKERACSIEQALIKFWQTQDPEKGYNISGGGECSGYIDGRTSDVEFQRAYNRSKGKKFREKHKNDPAYLEKHHARGKIYYENNKDNPEFVKHKSDIHYKWWKKKTDAETPEERAARLARNNERARLRRLNETPEERERRLAKQREANKKNKEKKKEEQQREQDTNGPAGIRDDKEASN